MKVDLMKKRILLIAWMATLSTLPLQAQEKIRLVTDRSLELTGFQDPRPYTPAYDLRNDFVMAYGIHASRVPALQSWVDQGYVPHLMTGIAWGDYQDFKDVSGRGIMSLAQIQGDGKERLHHPGVPYVVPSIEFADYITEKLKPMLDAGVLAIHLEEPEFWADTGFSPAFAREWQLYYHEPYERADSSPDAQYKASRLKYYLYGRALRRVAEACKEYAFQKYQRQLRLYVPTHSLISYTQWAIVSPQSSLIDSSRRGWLHRAGLDRHGPIPEHLSGQDRGTHVRRGLPGIWCDAGTRARDESSHVVPGRPHRGQSSIRLG